MSSIVVLKNSIPLDCTGLWYSVKDKLIQLQPWSGMRFQEVEATEFKGNRHMKVVRLSALHTGHLNRLSAFHWNFLQLVTFWLSVLWGKILKALGVRESKIQFLAYRLS